MKLEKLPAVHQNLMVAFAECKFVHLLNGKKIGSGVITRALNAECLEAFYLRAGEKEERRVVLNLPLLHYDGDRDSGFVFGAAVHDYSEIT
jgi:hypothetical protein